MNELADPRVLHLIPRFDRGGAERVISNLASGMSARAGWGVVATSGGDGTGYLDKRQIPWIRAPLSPSSLPNLLRSIVVLRRIVRERGIELIHSHHRFCSLVGRIVARSSGIPFVATVHDLASGNRLVSRWALGDTVTVFSKAVEAHLVTHFRLEGTKIHLVPLRISPFSRPTNARIAETKRERGLDPQTPIVGFLGRLVHEKGPDLLLRAAPQVLARFPDVHFWLVGNGDLRKDLEALAWQLGIDRSVTFLDGLDDVYPVLSCFEVAVVPSRREGFGLAALEALAVGKPVIATRVGGLPELVRHEENGLLVPSGDPVAIGEAICAVLGDPNMARQLAEKAHEMAQGYLILDAMFEETRLIYESLMGQQRRAGRPRSLLKPVG